MSATALLKQHEEASIKILKKEQLSAIVAKKFLASKVKCSKCGRHYIGNDDYIEDRTDLPGEPSLTYLDEERTISAYAEKIDKLKILNWVGYDNPKELNVDLKCVCGWCGFFPINPNPLNDIFLQHPDLSDVFDVKVK